MIKLIDLLYILSGTYDIIDNETDNCGASYVASKTSKFTKDGKVYYESDFKITEYGKKHFEKVLNSEVISIREDGYIVLNCEWEYIDEFLNACSGWISEDEYNKIFGGVDSE